MATKLRENGGLCPRKRPSEDPLLQGWMDPFRSQEAANCSNSGRIRRRNEPTEQSMDLELTGRIEFRKIGAGLENLGNTCFLNSVLQCLTYTEPLAAYLQSGRHKKICRASGFCAMCAIQNHVMNALASSGKILAPSHLVKNLRCISRNFRISRQEDAHEYMVNLMESMHRCCLPSGIASESPSAYEKSLVHKIFGGRLRNQVKCTQCSYGSNKYDPFLDLSLQIVQADSLLKALSQYFAVEQLDGGEKVYQCERCKVKVQALIQLTVDKSPYILAIHLKRFSPGGFGGKINKKVEFGPALDMKPFVSGPHEGDLKYTLYGVLVHAGSSSNSGHYYCFIRTSSGIWYALDDNRVYQVSEKSVLDQKAYMLFYVRNRRATNQSIFKHEHQGSIPKNDKAKPANVVSGKESLSLASSAVSILRGSLYLNSNNAAVSEAKDSVPRKETLFDRNSFSDVAEPRHNMRLPFSASEQPVSFESLSKLPSTWNSDGIKKGSMVTQGVASNGLQDVAPISNVCRLDPGADNEHKMATDSVDNTVNEHKMAKDSVDNTDCEHKASIHLSNSVAIEGHKIVEVLENGDIMNHEHGKRHSPAKEMPDCKKINQGTASVHQVDKGLMNVQTNFSNVTDLGNNDSNISTSGNVSIIAQDPGNRNCLLSKDHADLGVSLKTIEPGSLSNLTEECSCLLQKQDSNSHLHSKKVRLWKQYLRLLRIMPFTRGHLLLRILNVSRRKSSLKRKKRYLLKSKSSSQGKSMNLLKHDKRFLTSQDTFVSKRKKRTTIAAQETRVVGNKPGINVAKSMLNGKYCLDSCEDVENYGLKVLPVQNNFAFVKAKESNFQSRLHLGFAQCSSRQICTQDGLGEERCSGTVAEGSGTMCLKHNGNAIGPCCETNQNFFSSVMHSVQKGDASASKVGVHDRRHGTSSKFWEVSAQDRAKVAQIHFTSLQAGLREATGYTGISQSIQMEADGEEIDTATDEKKASDGHVLNGWVKEHEFGRRKKVKTSPSENGMMYGDKRHFKECKNHFEVISSSKLKSKQSRGRHGAARNEPARI